MVFPNLLENSFIQKKKMGFLKFDRMILDRLFRDFFRLFLVLFNSLKYPELKNLEWDILNPDRLINLKINNKRRKSIT